MISKHLTILPAVAVLLLSTGCSNDDMDGVLADGPVAAQVTAAIRNGHTATRASITDNAATFDDGDAINVVKSGTDTYQYSLSGSTWSAVSTLYYFQDLNAVSFRGWYATTTPTDNSISIDTKTQTTTDGWNEWDILATPEVTATAASPTINFTDDNAFTHVMSQVTLTFKAGNGVSDLAALSQYALTDIITDADFNTLTCELTTGSTTGDITQDIEASGTEYTCTPVILVPQEVSGKLSLKVTYNGLTYVTDLILPESVTAMAAGTHYAFNVNINNTGLTVNSATIANWTTDSGTGSATIKPNYTYTEENGIRTYTVYTEAGLLAWSEYTRSGHWSTNCTLAADITLTAVESGSSNWTAIGDNSTPYTGTFDGNDHTISGLTINNSSSNQGLIGCLDSGGVVQNLTMEGVNISNSTEENYFHFGAVVGHNYGGTVTHCSVSGEVSGYRIIGGVVGFNDGTVSACSSTTTLSGNQTIGGVVGYNNQNGIVNACYSKGSVSGDRRIGGVVGNNYEGTITACYATGSVSGDENIGGVVGNNTEGYVTACYFAGAVSSTGNSTGGVVGRSYNGTAITCYWTNSSSDTGAAEYGIGSTSSNDNANEVTGDVTWTTAKDAMNTALTGTGWQYDGDGTSDPPLTLVEQ